MAFASCRKFEGDQTIPAYIKIDSISLNTDYQNEGSNSAKINTIWIYVNGENVGIYEVPVFAPILARDVNELTLQAGIFLNGVSNTRAPYPFYKPITQDVIFEENKILNINDSAGLADYTVYFENTVFVWMEDFEDPSVSLDSIPPSAIDIQRTSPANHPEAYLSDNSRFSGYLELTEGKNAFRITTNVGNDEGFELPQANNWPVFLEFNYKCNQAFEVGVFSNEIDQVLENPVAGANPSEEWNKLYVNLKPIVNFSINALDFNIYFTGILPEGMSKGEIYLDNIKLIYRSSR
jgi:hypothetical protein